jgi:hypothetical protein
MKHCVSFRSVLCVRWVSTFFFALIVVLSISSASAQTNTGRIEGTVQDSTGAVVPNAKVVVTHLATKTRTEITTNLSGAFVANALQLGTYSLTVEAPGFRKTVVNDIELDVAAIIAQKITLEVGQVSDSVQVEANTVAVQTTDAQVARAITMRDIDTLPQLARTPLSLVIFQPGVQVTVQGSDTSFSHVNGLRGGSNNSSLDGIDVNDSVVPRLGLSLTANNTDSVEEFRVVTDGGKAEYGRNAGGQVELVTRSGTNQFHGNAFDYLRNTDLNASDFFANLSGQKRPVLIQNIYGGSFGGPIKHNKLFIFGNYQGRQTHSQITRTRTVPTDTAKQGIFEWIPPGSSAVQQFNIITNDPKHLGIDPSIAALLKIYPEPNNNNVGDGLNSAGYTFNNPNNSLEDQFTIKADYNLSATMHTFFRESWERNSSIDSLNSADAPFPGQVQGTQGGHRWGVAAGWDWTINPSTVNEFRYGHQSASVSFNRPERIAGDQYSSFNTWTVPILANFAQARNSPVQEFTDNITKVHNNHTFKAGVHVQHTLQYGTNDAGIYPNLSLSTGNGDVTTINPPGPIASADLTRYQGMYNDLLGRVSSVTQTFLSNLTTFQAPGTTRLRNFNWTEMGFFVQDDWKIRRNLTLSIGLRYELATIPSESNGYQGIFTVANQINMASQINNLTVQKSGNWFKQDRNNFSPRFGFSYDPKGDGKTAIRGGFGIFFDRAIGATVSAVDGGTPGFSQSIQTFPNLGNADYRASQGLAAVSPVQPGAPVLEFTPSGRSATTPSIFNPNLATGYVAQFNLNIQREIAKNTVVEVGYLGNRGIKLFYGEDLNQTRIYGDFLTAFQQIQGYVANNATVVPSNNTLVRIFGTPAAVVSAIGASTFSTGQIRAAANTLDNSYSSKYAAAGVSDFYLRNYPQFQSLVYGDNDGRSYYNSFQASLRRQVGALRLTANYTRSKSMDNTAGEGNGFTEGIDNFSIALNRARTGFDIPNAFNFSGIYTLPIGKGHLVGRNMPRWADTLIGGWDLGGLWVWQSGAPFSILSGRDTGPAGANALGTGINSYADFSGNRNIGDISKLGNGVFFLTPAQIAGFTFPVAGTTGTSARNAFRGPRYFDIDLSLVKKFRITEKQAVSFRVESYNFLNHENFANPGNNISLPTTFGKISATASGATPRIYQMALRYDF